MSITGFTEKTKPQIFGPGLRSCKHHGNGATLSVRNVKVGKSYQFGILLQPNSAQSPSRRTIVMLSQVAGTPEKTECIQRCEPARNSAERANTGLSGHAGERRAARMANRSGQIGCRDYRQTRSGAPKAHRPCFACSVAGKSP